MNTKTFVTKRPMDSCQKMGCLELPPPKLGDKDTLNAEGFCIHACFGDIFKPIPEFVNYRSGAPPPEVAECVAPSAPLLTVAAIVHPTPVRVLAQALAHSQTQTQALEQALVQSQVQNLEWVPVMSNYSTGQVLNAWVRGGGHHPNSGTAIASLKNGDVCLLGRDQSDALPGIAHAIAYRYRRDDTNIATDIDLLAQIAPKGSLLVIPAIGTNNGISFAEAACRLFYSTIAALSLATPSSPMKSNIRGILFISPLNGPGARTISHIINLFAIYRETRQEPECPVCMVLKQDMVLSCGHRFCGRCVLALCESSGGSKCPTCRSVIRHMSPCHKLLDSTNFECCAAYGQISPSSSSSSSSSSSANGDQTPPHTQPNEQTPPAQHCAKAPYIFVPCGHVNSLCFKCSQDELFARRLHTSPEICRVCKEPVMAYLRIYS
jgi:hypothetical protein